MATGARDYVAEKRPNIEITRLADDECEFILTGSDASMANALRRVMMAEVPTFAIDTVDVYENSTPMHDEFLAHRLGLIPIRWKPKDVLPQDVFFMVHECESIGYCPKCSFRVSLTVENDNDATMSTSSFVGSVHLVILPAEGQETPTFIGRNNHEYSVNDLFEIAHFVDSHEQAVCKSDEYGIHIATLGSKQRIELMCTVTMGIGKMHARYNPSATVAMWYEPVIKMNDAVVEKISLGGRKDFVKRNQPGVFEFNRENGLIEVRKHPLVHSGLVDEPGRTAPRSKVANNIEEIRKLGLEIAKANGQNENMVSVSFVPDKYIFNVETSGALRPEQIVKSGFRALRAKTEMLRLCLETQQ